MRMRTIQQPLTFVPAKNLYVTMYAGGMILRSPITDKKRVSPDLVQKSYDLLEKRYGMKIQDLNKPISFNSGTSLGMPDDPNPICDIATFNITPSEGMLIIQLGVLDVCEVQRIPMLQLYGTRRQYLMLMIPEKELGYDIIMNKTQKQRECICKRALKYPLAFVPNKHLNVAIRYEKDIHHMSYKKAAFKDDIVKFITEACKSKWKDEDALVILHPGLRITEMEPTENGDVVIRIGDVGKRSGRFVTKEEMMTYAKKKVYLHLVISKEDMIKLGNKI